MNFFNTFRGRLLIILAFLLITTLGVQYYLNLKTQRENNNLRAMQEQALVAGLVLGVNSLTSNEYMEDLVKGKGQPFFDEKTAQRIKDVIIIDDEWQIRDTLKSRDYLPTTENGQIKYHNLSELTNLPPLIEDEKKLGEDVNKFPNANIASAEDADGEAHAIPIQTTQGRWYVMVILENDKREAAAKAARPLVYTLLVLLLSTMITIFLVWRFTRPIANLSDASRRVAEGDLRVRVKGAERNDEIGKLTNQFNEMTAELEKTRQLEAQLQQAEKSAVVGRLASAIAHEIRNPLNYINLTLDHLRSKFAPEDAQKHATFEKLTAQLKTEVGRINQQVSDFLSYSRPIKLDLQPLEVREVIKDSRRIIEPQAQELNIKIGLVERENVPKILGDAEVLRSVFNNLLTNAMQAMETTGGNINMTISPDGNFVKIEVADKGIGIREENLSKIFEPYFSTRETGTGLGLAIVKKIVDDHNGTIDVASNLNEGTKFTVRLPSI
ncbi:ATP-binding protein [soil metagenome]|nr:HAMP domain-containing protein [Acidobacteriota bacterium]